MLHCPLCVRRKTFSLLMLWNWHILGHACNFQGSTVRGSETVPCPVFSRKRPLCGWCFGASRAYLLLSIKLQSLAEGFYLTNFQQKAGEVGNRWLAIVFSSPSLISCPLHIAAITHQSIRLSQM